MSEMALSPDVLAALAGPAQDTAAPQAPDAGGDDTVSILKNMIDQANRYLEVEDDEADRLTMQKVLVTLQQYLANEQKEHDDAMAGKASPRLLRQAYGT